MDSSSTRVVHHLRLPASGAAQGVVLVVPAPGGEGSVITKVEQEGWPAVADHLGFALMVSEFQASETRDFSRSRRGSGDQVLRALRAFSDQCGQRDLAAANFVIYGISSGAQFAASFAQDKPDRVYGFVAVLGAYWEPTVGGGRKTPGLFISAPDQSDGAAERTRVFVTEAREFGGYWAWKLATSRQSAVSETMNLAQDYLVGAVKLRQSPAQSISARPLALSPFKGWVVSSVRGTVEAASNVPRDQVRSTFWFPTEATARASLSK